MLEIKITVKTYIFLRLFCFKKQTIRLSVIGIFFLYIKPVFHLYVNLKREREARTWKIKQTIFYCKYSISARMTCARETRAWNRSLHVAIFHVHAQHSRARIKNKKTSFYARGNRETNWIHHKCPVLYEQSLK